MRKLVVFVAFAALAVPATAGAKEISSAKICGASGCAVSTDKDALLKVVQSSGSPVAAPPQAYFKISFQVTEPGRGQVAGFDSWWVPGADALVGRGESGPAWSRLAPDAVALLKATAAGLTPFPTPRLTRVLVGARAVRDPNSYLGLFDPAWRVVDGSAPDWKPITLRASAANPWTDGVNLLYSARKNILWRGADRVRVPPRIAANIEARRSLTALPPQPNRAWAWAAGAAALVTAAGAAAMRLVQRA